MKNNNTPIQIRLPREIVKNIDQLVSDGKFANRADFVRQKAIWAIEHQHIEELIDEVFANNINKNGSMNGILQQQVRLILKELLAESLNKD
jgi:metal-responsive CopG/Arc/MetJ family transcriptional regulator